MTSGFAPSCPDILGSSSTKAVGGRRYTCSTVQEFRITGSRSHDWSKSWNRQFASECSCACRRQCGILQEPSNPAVCRLLQATSGTFRHSQTLSGPSRHPQDRLYAAIFVRSRPFSVVSSKHPLACPPKSRCWQGAVRLPPPGRMQSSERRTRQPQHLRRSAAWPFS